MKVKNHKDIAKILEEEINNMEDITEWELRKRVKIIEKLLAKEYPVSDTDCKDILRGDFHITQNGHLAVGFKNKNRITWSLFQNFGKEE